ncbi:MAG: hypothetical protein K8H86_01495 [Ignavibacteriaceae bacterium]|nr:hypothetical protein [Ignavibacteriaceae bacterium]
MNTIVNKGEVYNFFNKLSERLSKENALSDVLASLLNSSCEFRKLFYKFLNSGSESQLIHGQFREAEREVPFEFGRPDMIINQHDGKRILIEIKRYDTDHNYPKV